MLMGPDFYWKAHEFAVSLKPQIRFSMQSNILGYSREKWMDLLTLVFKRSVSTSYDPDERDRLLKGSSEKYHRLFFKRLDGMLADGFRPTLIGTYTNETIALAESVYDRSLAMGGEGASFSMRVNYRYPVGRSFGTGNAMAQSAYADMLIRLYDRWVEDVPDFAVTPLDEMLGKVIGREGSRCPWTKSCGGRFLSIDPDGSVHNCAEFSSLGQNEAEANGVDPYKYGNINTDSMEDLLSSSARVAISRRAVKLPSDCVKCEHLNECEGGCARDSALYGRGLYGKFEYCDSWKAVFSRIKASVDSGEADRLVAKRFGKLERPAKWPLSAEAMVAANAQAVPLQEPKGLDGSIENKATGVRQVFWIRSDASSNGGLSSGGVSACGGGHAK